MRGYCVKCRTMREIKEEIPVRIKMKNRKVLTGTCPVCDKTIYKFTKEKFDTTKKC